ncbi:restriction endonuclease [Clostridium sp. CX1]|uniref:restriction endonuclease n=1 Tax=Clostridium sp. CX1 TaxID=2978346 RepID=UPI0021C11C40|nr:restriction endonuclease [Clostridium sp. CX1]MCT8976283.1 restriction endonuclease [Clostridium sp. CX1]
MNFIKELELVFIVFLIGYTAFLIKETISYLKLRILFTSDIKRLKNGIILVSDLHDNLTPNEFEHWCGDFLDKKGYLDVYVTPKGPDGGKDIICKKEFEKIYVECKRFVYSLNAKFKVDDDIARKLVGAMIGDNITGGVIITSGIFTDEAIRYIETLPSKYNFQLYDGKDLATQYSVLKTLKLTN